MTGIVTHGAERTSRSSLWFPTACGPGPRWRRGCRVGDHAGDWESSFMGDPERRLWLL